MNALRWKFIAVCWGDIVDRVRAWLWGKRDVTEIVGRYAQNLAVYFAETRLDETAMQQTLEVELRKLADELCG